MVFPWALGAVPRIVGKKREGLWELGKDLRVTGKETRELEKLEELEGFGMIGKIERIGKRWEEVTSLGECSHSKWFANCQG